MAGGLALALACDLRVADTTARLGDTSGRVGLLPDEGGAWLAARATAPITTKVVKRMVRHAEHQTLEHALHEAELAVSIVNDTDDVREGVTAFLEKRQPRFRGR